MKALFTNFFILFAIMAQSQEFAPIGAKWYYEIYNSGVNQSQQVVQTLTTQLYECIGEETINNIVWRKISTPQSLIIPLDFFYLREDDRKIWFYNSESGKTVMLYDLDPELGDVWTYPLSDESASHVPYFADYEVPTDSLMLRVDSISIVNFNGLPAKRIVLSRAFNGSEYQFIPGPFIMEPFGFLESFMIIPGFSIIDLDLPNLLRCYEDDYWGLISLNDTLSCDSAWVKIIADIETTSADEFKLYPNPGCQQLNIISPFKGSSSLIIRNSQGSVLFEKKYDDVNILLEDEIADLPAGIYLIDLINFAKVQRSTKRWLKE